MRLLIGVLVCVSLQCGGWWALEARSSYEIKVKGVREVIWGLNVGRRITVKISLSHCCAKMVNCTEHSNGLSVSRENEIIYFAPEFIKTDNTHGHVLFSENHLVFDPNNRVIQEPILESYNYDLANSTLSVNVTMFRARDYRQLNTHMYHCAVGSTANFTIDLGVR